MAGTWLDLSPRTTPPLTKTKATNAARRARKGCRVRRTCRMRCGWVASLAAHAAMETMALA